MATTTSTTPTHGVRWTRFVLTVLVAVAVIATACGSDDDTEATAGQPDQTAAEQEPQDDASGATTDQGETEDGEATSANSLLADIADFLTYELERTEITYMAGQMVGAGDPTGQARWELVCGWVPDLAGRLRAALPAARPAGAASEWDTYVAATEGYWAQYETECGTYDPEVWDEAAVYGRLDAAKATQIDACDELLVALEPSLPPDMAPPFCQYPDNVPIRPEEFQDLPPELEGFLSGGGPPPEEAFGPDFIEIDDPTGAPTIDIVGPEVWVALWPEAKTFDFIEPAITINNDWPWQFYSEPDFISLDNLAGPGDEPGMLNILAPSGIADPAQLVTYDDWDRDRVLPTIAVPDDLTEWVDQMPLVGTPTPTTVGGFDATYWVLEYDPEADANSVVVAAPESALRSYGPILGEVVLHLWHIPHPDGPLFIIENESAGGGESGGSILMTTPSMLATISLE